MNGSVGSSSMHNSIYRLAAYLGLSWTEQASFIKLSVNVCMNQIKQKIIQTEKFQKY